MKMLLLMAMLAVLGLTGCETMEGLGRDLQNLGDSIEGKSSDDG
jgi:predicted small secreted protein